MVQYNTDPELLKNEIEMDFFRSSGPGGQHANTSDTGVRIKHIPSGITVTCEEHRSQHRNREAALEKLIEKLKKKNKPKKKRKRTRPTRASKKRRLKNKKIRSEKKKRRRKVDPYDR